MPVPMTITVSVRGKIFTPNIKGHVKKCILEESLEKIGKRTERGGKGLGAKRNVITRNTKGLLMTVLSTRIRPRTKGTAWTRKNIAIIRAMAPRVLRKTAKRIIGEV